MRVAVLGASANPEKFGNKAVRAYLKKGWDVCPVNPKRNEINGLKCYSSLSAVPKPIDRLTIYLPPAISLELVDEIVAAGAKDVYLNPGAESDELITALKAKGVQPIMVCSILAIGLHPDDV